MERYISLSPDERLLMGVEGRRIEEKRFDIKDVIHIYENIVRSLSI